MYPSEILDRAISLLEKYPNYDSRRREAPHPIRRGFIFRATRRGLIVVKNPKRWDDLVNGSVNTTVGEGG